MHAGQRMEQLPRVRGEAPGFLQERARGANRG